MMRKQNENNAMEQLLVIPNTECF